MSRDNIIPEPVATVLLELLAKGQPFTMTQLEAAVLEHLEKHGAPPATSVPLVVHVLRAGLPLCGFSTRPPREWPPGHKWTTAPAGAIRPTCETCSNMLDVEDTTHER